MVVRNGASVNISFDQKLFRMVVEQAYSSLYIPQYQHASTGPCALRPWQITSLELENDVLEQSLQSFSVSSHLLDMVTEITIILVEIAVAWTSRHPPQILSNPFKAHPPINVAITAQKHHPPCENTRCMELLSWWTSQFTSRHGPAVQTSKSMLDSTWRSAHKNIIFRLYNASAARID
ncbi:hypothetical protein OG21DRAFT_163416 [Imleria badia]|nr:hypothetical protein OG21DRAFT_163416 [Imleria badia]